MTKTFRAGKMTSAVLLTSALLGGAVFAEKPAVWWASQSGKPGAHVMLAGGGWATNGTVRVLVGDKTVVPDMVSTDGLIFAWPAEFGTGAADVRVVSEGETSEPFRVNRTEPWWMMGDALDRSEPGGILRIFGRALASASCGAAADGAASRSSAAVAAPRSVADGAASRPSVRFLAGNGKAIPLSVVKATPFDLTCRLPADIAPDTYRVVVSTPEGGAAELGAWTVGAAVKFWKDDPFNIEDFGARPGDEIDDTAAIQRALDAAGAAGGGTVIVPIGTYWCSDMLRIPPHVLVKGVDRNASYLRWRDTRTPPEYLMVGRHSFGVHDLHIMSGATLHGIGEDSMLGRGGPKGGHLSLRDRRKMHSHDISVKRVRFDFISDYYSHVYSAEGYYLRMQSGECGNCGNRPYYGYCLQFANVRRVDIDDVILYCDRMAYTYKLSGEYVRLRNSRLIGNGNWCVLGGNRCLVENNDFLGMTCSVGPDTRRLAWVGNYHHDKWSGDHEAITTDLQNPMFRDAKQKNTAKTEKLLKGRADGTKLELFWSPDVFERVTWTNPEVSDWVGYEVSVAAGHGIGQIRTITAFPDDHHLEIDRPWDVSPDETSRFSISSLRTQMLFADNVIENTGTLQFYGGACGAVITGNRIRNAYGMGARGMVYSGVAMPTWYCEYVGNVIDWGRGRDDPSSIGCSLSTTPWMTAWVDIRDNVIKSGGLIRTGGRNVIAEGNEIENGTMAVRIEQPIAGIFIASNAVENVDRLYVGGGRQVKFTEEAKAVAARERIRRAAEAGRRGKLDHLAASRLLGIAVEVVPGYTELKAYAAEKRTAPVPVLVKLTGDRFVTPEITSVTARFRPVDGLGLGTKRLTLKKDGKTGEWTAKGEMKPTVKLTPGTSLPVELELAGPDWTATVDWTAPAGPIYVTGWQLAYLEKNALPGEKDTPAYAPFAGKVYMDLKKDFPPAPPEAKALLLTSYLVVTKPTPVQFTKRDGFGGLWIDGRNVLTAMSPLFVCLDKPIARTLEPGIHRLDYLRPLEVKHMPRVALGSLQVAVQPLVPLEPGQLRLFATKEKADAACP